MPNRRYKQYSMHSDLFQNPIIQEKIKSILYDPPNVLNEIVYLIRNFIFSTWKMEEMNGVNSIDFLADITRKFALKISNQLERATKRGLALSLNTVSDKAQFLSLAYRLLAPFQSAPLKDLFLTRLIFNEHIHPINYSFRSDLAIMKISKRTVIELKDCTKKKQHRIYFQTLHRIRLFALGSDEKTPHKTSIIPGVVYSALQNEKFTFHIFPWIVITFLLNAIPAILIELTKGYVALSVIACFVLCGFMAPILSDKTDRYSANSSDHALDFIEAQIITRLGDVSLFNKQRTVKQEISTKPPRLKENSETHPLTSYPLASSNNCRSEYGFSKKSMHNADAFEKKEASETLTTDRIPFKEISWEFKNGDCITYVSYTPSLDIRVITKLWTTNPSWQALNNRHYVFWDKAVLKQLNKKWGSLFESLLQIGLMGRMVNATNKQGYIYLPERESFKIKSKSLESGAYRLFLAKQSCTHADGESMVLHTIDRFEKTH